MPDCARVLFHVCETDSPTGKSNSSFQSVSGTVLEIADPRIEHAELALHDPEIVRHSRVPGFASQSDQIDVTRFFENREGVTHEIGIMTGFGVLLQDSA